MGCLYGAGGRVISGFGAGKLPGRSVKRRHEQGWCSSAPGDLLRTHWPVTVASFRTWRGWRDCVAQDPAHL